MTIKDVAQRSGYAVGTVSRVLNGHPGVSEEARLRILKVVEELGFKPNSNARHLKQREGSGFCIVVKGAHNMLFAGIVEEMQSRIKDAGQSATVYYVDEDDDDVEGAAQAMGLLLDAGHRKVGIIGGDSCQIIPILGCNTSQLRLLGCQRASIQRGLPFKPEEQSIISRYSMEGGYEAAGLLLDRLPDLTAILAMSDVMAIGALRAIHDRGLRVPDDISLIGCDGIEQVNYCVPRLSTVRQNVVQLARRGVDIMIQQTGGGQAVHEIVPFELIHGESVRVVEVREDIRSTDIEDIEVEEKELAYG